MVANFQFLIFSDFLSAKESILDAAKNMKSKPAAWDDEIFFKASPGFGSYKVSFSIFISEQYGSTFVRIVLSGTNNDSSRLKVYDKFLTALISTGVRITAIPGNYKVVSAQMIGDGTEQKIVNRFGGVANNISGARIKTVMAKSVPFRILYANGMVEEKEIKRNTPLFEAAMSNLNRIMF